MKMKKNDDYETIEVEYADAYHDKDIEAEHNHSFIYFFVLGERKIQSFAHIVLWNILIVL